MMIDKIKNTILNFDFGMKGNNKYIILFVFAAAFVAMFGTRVGTRLHVYHWLFDLSLAVVVIFFGIQRAKGLSIKDTFKFIFPKKIWTHQSTANDVIISVLNFFVGIFSVGLIKILQISALGAAGYYLCWVLSLPQFEGNPTFTAAFLFTIFIGLSSDLGYYWAHRLAHTSHLWWEFHKVHHSAEVMTPVTLLRYHPLDDLLYAMFRRSGQAFASGFFLYAYPTVEGLTTVVSANIIIKITEYVGGNLRHSHIWLSFGSKLEHILISPALHQIHHSDKKEHFDKNFGATFAIWDWMFGTLYVPEKKEDIKFGLGVQSAQYDTVGKMYFHPFARVYHIIKRRRKAKKEKAALPLAE